MTRSVIESRYEVGHTVFCTHQLCVHDSEDKALHEVIHDGYTEDEDRIFPLIQMRVVGVRLYRYVDGEFVAVRSALENIYKVVRNRNTGMNITLLTREMTAVIKVEWPASQPFHDAFGPIEEGKFRQIIYVSALNVDGNYKLIEVLDDQDW